MSKTIALITAAVALVLSMGTAQAAETKQQNKMASCSADFKATGKDGKERQGFMKECLSASKQEKQQGKMATCSTEFKATGKDTKERQAFMKTCLSNKPEAAAAPKADAKPAATVAAAAPKADAKPAAAAAAPAASAAKK
jgi:hypothetical protein